MPEPSARSARSESRTEPCEVLAWAGGQWTRREDQVAVEAPLEMRVGGRAVSVTMRTPGHDEELVAGFLLGEGLVRAPAQIVHLRRCPGDGQDSGGDRLDAILSADTVVDLARLVRHVVSSSSCGLCGVATLEALRRSFPPPRPGPSIATDALHLAMERLRAAQAIFDATGGLHAAGLFDARGDALVVREDIGRHNAVDKVLGHALLAGRVPASDTFLAVSGRASFEIVQKALAAGVPIVAAVSAPSSLAVDLARESGMTLAGFVRPARLNLYAGPERLLGATGPLD